MSPDAEWLSAAQRLSANAQNAGALALCFAIGKYFDDIGESEAAFEHYRRANELAKRAAPRHDRARLSRATDRIIRCQSASWLLRHSGTAAGDSEQAVFIVGMPRSGTTLLEQILASHPAVHGAGEITFWGERAAEVLLEHGTSGPVALEGDAAKLAQLGREYLALLRERCPPARRVVSKWPGNFWFSGVIHAALPRARFIHVRRHPIDTCLSIYFQHFEAANAYSNDLEDLAQYYRDYERLMRHFKHLLPAGRLMEIDYEEVVRDIESAARTLLDFLELPWDARCVEFHRHPRSVLTASRWQVRQELYASSVGRWRRYARHLGPLQSLAEPPCA
jgi:tetratricopeptide (TPR) repeat protein